MMREQLDDLAAVARAIEPAVDAGVVVASRAVDVDGAVDAARIEMEERPVGVGDVVLAGREREQKCAW